MKIHKTNMIQQLNQIHLMNVSSDESDSSNKKDSAYETKVLNVTDSFDVNNSTSNKGLNKMSKSKEQLQTELDELNSRLVLQQDELDSLTEVNLDLQIKLEKSLKSKDGRKSEVLNLLQTNESISILELAKEINISTKNVSSQLTYLRQDGYKIFTDNNGRKVLMP